MVRMIEKLRRFRITVVESQAQKSYSKTVIGPITYWSNNRLSFSNILRRFVFNRFKMLHFLR